MNRSEKRLAIERRVAYLNGWDVLATWATCYCPKGYCPLEAELSRLGITPGGLLLALVLGDPTLMVSE